MSVNFRPLVEQTSAFFNRYPETAETFRLGVWRNVFARTRFKIAGRSWVGGH